MATKAEDVQISAPEIETPEPTEPEKPIVEQLSPEEGREVTQRFKSSKKKKGLYEIGAGRLGEAINGILKAVEKAYPSLSGQLVLDDFEKELLDDAFKPLLEAQLKRLKFPASNLEMVFAVFVILVPRILAAYSAANPTLAKKESV